MKKRIGMVCLLFSLAIILAGCDAAVRSAEDPVVEPVAKKPVIEAFGIVQCRVTKNISLEFPATITSITVREGQVVSKGEILAMVNPDEMDEQIKTAKLQLSGEKSISTALKEELTEKKELLESQRDPDIVKLQNDLENALENYSKLLKELESKKNLEASGSITHSEVVLFEKDTDAAGKAIRSIELSLDSLTYDRKMEIRQLQNQMITQENSIRLLERELELLKGKTRQEYILDNGIVCIMDKAVIDGVFVDSGDRVVPSAKLFSLKDLDTQYVEARIPEEFIKDVKVGMEAVIIPVADKTRNYQGTVVGIGKKAQQRNGETNVLAEIEIKNDDGFLIPDFNVDIEIPSR